jgi:hypothetical protein
MATGFRKTVGKPRYAKSAVIQAVGSSGKRYFRKPYAIRGHFQTLSAPAVLIQKSSGACATF